MNYYEHHLGDYSAATAHLSWDEDMAYQRLIRAYYHTERPIPSDMQAACRLVRAESKAQRAAVATVLQEFFDPTPDGWRQKRCDAEIARYKDKQAKASRSANARWSAKPPHSEGNANAHANASPDAMRTHSEGNAPRHQTPDTIPCSKAAGSDSAQNADPPTPPPAFDGTNAEALNGKAIVPLAASWELPEQWGLDAEALGWKSGEVLREAEKLRQWATEGKGKGTRRSVKGWRQTWSNWLEKAARDRK